MGEVERERQEQIIYDDYEESFYYDEPSSDGSDASGEALGLGIGLGIGGVASLLGPVFIGYDSDARMYTIMAVCFGVTVLWGFIAWKCIVKK